MLALSVDAAMSRKVKREEIGRPRMVEIVPDAKETAP